METPRLDPIPDLGACICKIFWGDAYVVAKCRTFARLKTIIEDSLDRYLRKGKHDLMYERFFFYIKAYPNCNFRVKVLFKSENPYELLVKEQEWLDKSKFDLNCMNNSWDAYIPKGIQGDRKAWINRGHYLNFMNWKRNRESKTSE